MWLTVDPNSINAVNILNKIQTNPTFLLNLILFLSMLDIYVQNDKGKRSKWDERKELKHNYTLPKRMKAKEGVEPMLGQLVLLISFSLNFLISTCISFLFLMYLLQIIIPAIL